jgi:hypothetical protein
MEVIHINIFICIVKNVKQYAIEAQLLFGIKTAVALLVEKRTRKNSKQPWECLFKEAFQLFSPVGFFFLVFTHQIAVRF